MLTPTSLERCEMKLTRWLQRLRGKSDFTFLLEAFERQWRFGKARAQSGVA